MRTSILAFAAVLMITGCGDNGTVKLDGSTNNKPDLKMNVTPPDLAMGTASNCGAIFQCLFLTAGGSVAKCEANTPQASKDTFNAVVTCQDTACGVGVDAGASSPCSDSSMATDAGVDACNTCIENTWLGPNTIFGDMNGMPQACTPDNNAPHCGDCAKQVTDCFVQCTTDADCAGITSGGAPTTCQSGSCM